MYFEEVKMISNLSAKNGGDSEIRTHGTPCGVRRLSKALD